jgi:hypothetical protein
MHCCPTTYVETEVLLRRGLTKTQVAPAQHLVIGLCEAAVASVDEHRIGSLRSGRMAPASSQSAA